ncbi:MAG: formylglycine-generating enzyme family protein, partial [Methylocella sp.]
AATQAYDAQTATRATVSAPARSGKAGLLLGALALLIAAAAASYFLFIKPAAPVSGGATVTTPAVAEGMELIPAGSYVMGRNLTDAEKKLVIEFEKPGSRIQIFNYDWPGHEVSVSSFYLDRTEVSNAQYAEFVKATGYAAPDAWNGSEPPPNAELIPVTFVNYQDARAYCAWRSKSRNDGLTYRLPTEEEWEFAARGKDAGKPGASMKLYPWGDEWIENGANTKESRLGYPRNVDAYPQSKSPFGILNLAGNVSEWTSSDFNHYPGGNQQTPREPGYQGTYQVVRGGGFAYPKEAATTTNRLWAKPTDKGPKLGFRCAADAKR